MVGVDVVEMFGYLRIAVGSLVQSQVAIMGLIGLGEMLLPGDAGVMFAVRPAGWLSV